VGDELNYTTAREPGPLKIFHTLCSKAKLACIVSGSGKGGLHAPRARGQLIPEPTTLTPSWHGLIKHSLPSLPPGIDTSGGFQRHCLEFSALPCTQSVLYNVHIYTKCGEKGRWVGVSEGKLK
jgi:hypothetical protein